jgi:glycosyltransferase involved in cell wall biosynthesis
MSCLVVLTTSWPRFPGDTAGSFVFQWCLGLARLGHSLVVLCPFAVGYPAHEVTEGIEVHRVEYALSGHLFYRAGAPENLASSWRAWLEIPFFLGGILGVARQYAAGVDLIIGHWVLPMGLLAATLGEALGIRSVAIAHSGDVHLLSKAPRLIWPVLRHLFRKTRLACVAPHQKKILARIGTPTVIPMGIEGDLFEAPKRRDPARDRLQLTGFIILFMGRLVPIKGVGGLVRAAANLDITLLIAGEGPEREHLERLAHQQKVSCVFLGHVSGPGRLDAFAAADAFVLPSLILDSGRSEGLPVSLLEAAAAGLPCLASTSGGAADTFTPEEEMLFFPANDEAALRVQLLRLLEDEALRESLATRAKERAQELRWSVIAARYAELLGLSVRS